MWLCFASARNDFHCCVSRGYISGGKHPFSGKTRYTRAMSKRLTSKLLLLTALLLPLFAAAQPVVHMQATPDEGRQPRLVTDSDGGIHLLYFKTRLSQRGAREGSLFYRPWLADARRFGNPVRVSSQAFNLQSYAIARAAMAIGGDGRLHVMWYLPRNAEYFYTRSNTERTQFEAQQQIVTDYIEGVDAGGDIAAFGDAVAVVWGAGDLSQEDRRTMFARLSRDNGASFGAETMISNPDLGACACCSMAADFLNDEALTVAYRSAIDGVGRHMQLLTVALGEDGLRSASYQPVQPRQEWEASFCPLSTNDIARHGEQRWLVFETESRVMQMPLAEAGEVLPVGEPYTETRQKNPALAINAEGERLVVWGEAISHTRGGRLNARVFDAAGADSGYRLADEIQLNDFTFPAAAALPDGSFLVLY